MESIISKGAFGKVYRAVRRSDGMVFALKQVDFEGMKRNEVRPSLNVPLGAAWRSLPYLPP